LCLLLINACRAAILLARLIGSETATNALLQQMLD